MNNEQATKPEQIHVKYKDKVVQIYCDEILLTFLANTENGALQLAEYILQEYQIRMNKPLAITKDSLAIEIIAHVYADELAEHIQDFAEEHEGRLQEALNRLSAKVKASTRTIDCGEKSEDNNRFIWDALEPLKDVIYKMVKD